MYQQDNSVHTINNSRSRLASIVTNTTDLDRCSKFIDKVREDRYGKIKDTQVRKFNILNSKSNNKASNNLNRVVQGSDKTVQIGQIVISINHKLTTPVNGLSISPKLT